MEDLRPSVAAVVRLAAATQASGNVLPVSVLIRRLLRGRSRIERLRFEATLAWTAGQLASLLPDDEREAFFAGLLETDDEMRTRLRELLS